MKGSGKATNLAEYAQMFPLCAEKGLSAERAILINLAAGWSSAAHRAQKSDRAAGE